MGDYIQNGYIVKLNEKYNLENINFNEIMGQKTYKINSERIEDLYRHFDELITTHNIEFENWIKYNKVINIKSAKVIKSEDNSEMDANSLLIHCYIK